MIAILRKGIETVPGWATIGQRRFTPVDRVQCKRGPIAALSRRNKKRVWIRIIPACHPGTVALYRNAGLTATGLGGIALHRAGRAGRSQARPR
jgi:hypothetical protein